MRARPDPAELMGALRDAIIDAATRQPPLLEVSSPGLSPDRGGRAAAGAPGPLGMSNAIDDGLAEFEVMLRQVAQQARKGAFEEVALICDGRAKWWREYSPDAGAPVAAVATSCASLIRACADQVPPPQPKEPHNG